MLEILASALLWGMFWGALSWALLGPQWLGAGLSFGLLLWAMGGLAAMVLYLGGEA